MVDSDADPEAADTTATAQAASALVETADDALQEYDRGYIDADAALRRLRPAIERLRAELED